MVSAMKSARQVALDLVSAADSHDAVGAGLVRERRGGLRDAMSRAIRANRLAPPDAALVTELVYGAVRHAGSLDAILAHFSNAPLRRLHPRVRAALRLGVYQIVFLDRVPDSAAVNETVKLAKAAAGPRSGRFANGVLRAVCRDLEDADVEALDPAHRPRAVCARDGRFARFRSNLLPAPESDPAGWLAGAYSMPRWLAKRWVTRWGLADAERLCAAHNRTPQLFVRANVLRTTRDALIDALRAQGLDAKPGGRPECVDTGPGAPIAKLAPALGDGLCSVQDDTAMHVAPRLEPQPGERVLDVCAAPGGKATHLAELSRDQAHIVALDLGAEGLARVAENARRLRLASIHCVRADGLALPVRDAFDKVLLDVPCSNTGVLARRADARWRLREADIGRLAELQLQLLRAAALRLRPGGRLAYCTCSVEAEENESVVRRFLAEAPEFDLVNEVVERPQKTRADGGYTATLTRKPT